MLKEAEIKGKCLGFIRDTKDSTKREKQCERMTQYQDFFRGNHWTEEMYNTYKSAGVEPITINRCRPVVKAFLGMYLTNKQSVKVKPRRSGTQKAAEVYTEMLKHVEDSSAADYVYAKTIQRGSIDTEAYLVIVIDKKANINGQPKVKMYPLRDVDTDINAEEYDLNESSKFVILKDWIDRDELDIQYPEYKDMIGNMIDAPDMDTHIEQLSEYMADDDYDYENEEDDDKMLLNKYRYLVRTVYWKEPLEAVIVADRQTSTIKIITEEKQVKKLRKAAKKSRRFNIQKTVSHQLHKCTFLGHEMLEIETNPYGEDLTDFPVFRFCPYWDLGWASGVLDDAVSLNSEENIHRTQTIRLLNQTANSGWITGGGTPANINKLKNFGSVEGVVIDKTDYGNFLEKIKSNKLDSGFFTMGIQFEQDIKRVTGVDDATQGYDTGRTESGRAIKLKQMQNQVSAEPVFNNFYYTLQLMGEYLLRLLRKNEYYTDNEIKFIVSESSLLDAQFLQKAQGILVAQLGADLPMPQQPMPIDPMAMTMIRDEDKLQVIEDMQYGMEAAAQYGKSYPMLKQRWDEVIKRQAVEMLLQEIKTDKFGEYGVKVTVSPSAPTERLARFIEMDALQSKYGQIIPPDLFIDATDLPNKEEIKARLQQQQQMMQMAQAGAA